MFSVTTKPSQSSRLLYSTRFAYINDLSDNQKFNVKLFADGTSLFLVVNDSIGVSQKINKDLDKVGLLAKR